MRRIIVISSFALLAALTGAGRAADPPKPEPKQTDRERAQGKWVIAKLEWPKEEKDAPTQKAIDEVVFVIKGDRITILIDGKTDDISHVVFTEDAAKSPRQVNFIATQGPESREPLKLEIMGEKDGKLIVVGTITHPPLQAIYKFEGDELIVTLPLEPKVARPTEFKPQMATKPESRSKSPVIVLHLTKKK